MFHPGMPAAMMSASPPMKREPMPRLAANLGYLFADRPLLGRFGAAAARGFSAVELTFPYGESAGAVRREIERHRLTLLGINTPIGPMGEPGLAGIPGRERDFADLFHKALDYATAVGAISIHCLSGQVPPHQQADGEKVFAANIAYAADLAGERGLTILLEPINRRDRPGYVLHRVEQAAAVIDQVGRPNVRIQFDFYHVQIEGGDLMTRFAHHQSVIGHVQISAVPSRAEPDEGEVNYAAILDMLDDSGYAGYVACEYKPRKRTEDGLGWAKRYGIG